MKSESINFKTLIDAQNFASHMVMAIEFSDTTILDYSVNPYGLLPIIHDESICKETKDLFKGIVKKPVSWRECGVSYIPEKIQKFLPNGFTFEYTEEACKSLDCFGYSDLNGTLCSKGSCECEINTASEKIIACRPSCFLLNNVYNFTTTNVKTSGTEPSHLHIFFDKKLRKCRIGCNTSRQFCLLPKLRLDKEKQGFTDVPPFSWNPQTQSCSITEAYCTSYFAMDYKNEECITNNGQKLSEFIVGKNFTRTLLKWFRNSQTNSVNYLLKKEQERFQRIEQTSKNGIDVHADIVQDRNISMHIKSLVLEKKKKIQKLNSSSSNLNTEDIFNLEKNNDTTQENSTNNNAKNNMRNLGFIAGATTLLISANLGIRISAKEYQKFLQKTVSWTLQHAVLLNVERRTAELVGSAACRKMFSLLAVKVCAQVLAKAAAAVNPALFVIDVLTFASLIWDFADSTNDQVLGKDQLDEYGKQFRAKWNLQFQKVLHNDSLYIKELSPSFIYMSVFGCFTDPKSVRYSSNRMKTWTYYLKLYFDLLTQNPDGTLVSNNETEIKEDAQIYLDSFSDGYNNEMNMNSLARMYVEHLYGKSNIEPIKLNINKRHITNSLHIPVFTVLFSCIVLFSEDFLSSITNILVHVIFIVVFMFYFCFMFLYTTRYNKYFKQEMKN